MFTKAEASDLLGLRCVWILESASSLKSLFQLVYFLTFLNRQIYRFDLLFQWMTDPPPHSPQKKRLGKKQNKTFCNILKTGSRMSCPLVSYRTK